MIPPRCYVCARILGTSKMDREVQAALKNNTLPEFFKKRCISRYCCQQNLMGYLKVWEYLENYTKPQ